MIIRLFPNDHMTLTKQFIGEKKPMNTFILSINANYLSFVKKSEKIKIKLSPAFSVSLRIKNILKICTPKVR